jgi:hypothetical protein
MHPAITDLHALGALLALRVFDGCDCVNVRAGVGVHDRRVLLRSLASFGKATRLSPE